jgi:hypothetical protein
MCRNLFKLSFQAAAGAAPAVPDGCEVNLCTVILKLNCYLELVMLQLSTPYVTAGAAPAAA